MSQDLCQRTDRHFQLQGLNCPVENVSWYDALAFCDQLNQRLINQPPLGYRFSLPTEAQWEYACRAGTQTLYYSGDTEADLARVAWYASNSDQQTHPVGEKEPNAWGLYDMHGNVYEWCHDSPSDYPDISVVDWVGEGDGLVRVVRSGSWGTPNGDYQFRATSRGCVEPDSKRPWIGFRLCLRWIDEK
jgi:formylglycine-generating enzyme required for sulfatase activity